ncbi:MAG TPA: TRAP transporter TatT component family protein [Polyangiaceae bacterium]|nr:TRAP transporter TatT component family protein [Polyangiaceae bacterium]
MRALLLGCLLCTGCIETILTNGEIASTRQAATSFDTLGDYELAKVSTQAGLAQFEGMHKIAPDNEDALFMLVQGWGGYAWGFVEDEMEEAELEGRDAAAEYHKKRAKMAYDRAVFYGLELLSHKDKGFEKAKKNEMTMNAWLKEHFDSKEDAENLFWVGYAWMSRVNLLQGDSAMVADLYIGVDMMQRAFELEPTYYASSPMVAMAAYHGRTADSEVKEARALFEQALKNTKRGALTTQLTYAQFACIVADKKLYDTLVDEIIAADDPDPSQRLNNTIAKRRASRMKLPKKTADCGFP